MPEHTMSPLNLYSNYEEYAQFFPNSELISDEILVAFPELALRSTYQNSLEVILQRAYQLSALGVKKGDKVILFKSPKFDTYLLAVAVSYLGAVPAMISYHFPAKTMEIFGERLAQPFIIYDQQTEPVIAQLANYPTEKQISVAQLLATSYAPVPQEKLALEEISYITHTSGTTGVPKLICHSAQSMGWRTTWQREVFGKIKEKGLLAFHISPVHSRFNIGISSAMAFGFSLMPLASPKVDSLITMLEKEQPLALETHPNHFVQWHEATKKAPHAFSSIRYYHSTFDAINNQTMAAFLTASAVNNPVFLQVYGQSECGPMILKSHRLPTIHENDARDMGFGLGELTKARIADENGQPLPANTPGNIHFRSKGRALTYFKEDERFTENCYDIWWDSGDYGVMNEEGALFLKDRQVDLIQSIDSSLALEDLLLDKLDFLSEVVIVKDKEHYPQPILALAADAEMDWDAWWQAVEDLPHLNKAILLDFDAIPRTATMKVKRRKLEAMLANSLI